MYFKKYKKLVCYVIKIIFNNGWFIENFNDYFFYIKKG